MAEHLDHHIYRQYVGSRSLHPVMGRDPAATPMDKEDLMDYKVVTVLDDGSVAEKYCATHTEVENELIFRLRQANATQCKLVNFTVANLWVKN